MLAMLGAERNGLAPQSAAAGKSRTAETAADAVIDSDSDAADETANGAAIHIDEARNHKLAIPELAVGAFSSSQATRPWQRPAGTYSLGMAQAGEAPELAIEGSPATASNKASRRAADSAGEAQPLRNTENRRHAIPGQGIPDPFAYLAAPVPQLAPQQNAAALEGSTARIGARKGVSDSLSESPGHSASGSIPSAGKGSGAGNSGGMIVPAGSLDGSDARGEVEIGPAADAARTAQSLEHSRPQERASAGGLNQPLVQPGAGSTANDGTMADAGVAAASIRPAANPPSIDLANADTPILEGDRHISPTAAVRQARGAGSLSAHELSAHAFQMQSASSAGETASPVRDVPGAMSPLRQDVGSATGSGIGPESGSGTGSAHETFAALDGDLGQGTTGWIHAGTHTAEAGFEDPAFGWVGVRADLGAAGVHAAVVPGSAEAVAALGGHMAGLHAYLAEHRTPVESLTITSPDGRGADSNFSQGMQQGSGHDAGRDDASGPPAHPGQLAPFTAGAPSREDSVQGSAMSETGGSARPAGTHISVMA
jgi:hypothetical protein